MLNVFDYYSTPKDLNHYDLRRAIDSLWELEHDQLIPEDKPSLDSVINIIKRSPILAYAYAQSILEDPWPEVEPVIMKDPIAATNYACNVLNKRWPEAEPVIMKSPHYSWIYARTILNHRWIEAEPKIKTNPTAWHMYKKDFNIDE